MELPSSAPRVVARAPYEDVGAASAECAVLLARMIERRDVGALERLARAMRRHLEDAERRTGERGEGEDREDHLTSAEDLARAVRHIKRLSHLSPTTTTTNSPHGRTWEIGQERPAQGGGTRWRLVSKHVHEDEAMLAAKCYGATFVFRSGGHGFKYYSCVNHEGCPSERRVSRPRHQGASGEWIVEQKFCDVCDEKEKERLKKQKAQKALQKQRAKEKVLKLIEVPYDSVVGNELPVGGRLELDEPHESLVPILLDLQKGGMTLPETNEEFNVRWRKDEQSVYVIDKIENIPPRKRVAVCNE